MDMNNPERDVEKLLNARAKPRLETTDLVLYVALGACLVAMAAYIYSMSSRHEDAMSECIRDGHKRYECETMLRGGQVSP